MNKKIIDAIIEMATHRVSFERERADKRELLNKKKKTADFYEHVSNLRNKGYSIIENFYTEKQCKELRDEIDRLHNEHSSKLWADPQMADLRLFGAEKYSKLINEFYSNEIFREIGEYHFNGKLWNSNTLAAKITAKEGNLGSGGGWHRDAHHFEYKAIVYLSDVTENNGAFQIIEGTHWFRQKLEDMLTMKIESLTTRYSDEEIQKVIDQKPENYKLMTAKAGTVLLVDTSTLHTGKPLITGERYTLFNYYFPSYDNKIHRLKSMGIDIEDL